MNGNNVVKINKNSKTQRRRRFPIWAFMTLSYLYFELLLYIVVGGETAPLAWLYITLSGIAFGTLVGGAVELIKKSKPRKITGISVLALAAVLFCVEFFVCRSFQTYMTLQDIIFGTEGIATGFAEVAFKSIFRGLWLIILYFVPMVLYIVFFRSLSGKKDSRIPLARMVAALLLQAICIGIISASPADRDKLSKQYNFDESVRTFGLCNALTLDVLDAVGGRGSSDLDFEIIDFPETEKDPEDTSYETGVDDPPKPIVYGKNEVDIDFAALAESTSKKDVAKLHNYVASLNPTSQNEFTGIFKGKNLILITAEAFSAEVIDPEMTPTLYRLANKGIKFTDYYQPAWGGSTSTGEYSILMGLVPMSGVKSIQNTVGLNLYYTIGNQLMREGYSSLAFHNGQHTYYKRNVTHKNFGYSDFIAMGNGMEEGVKGIWPASDEEMFKYTFDMYAGTEPFSVYYMTVSGHCLYSWTGNSMSKRNRDVFAEMDASETIKAYHAANYELEKGLTYLVSELEARGIADDTVIVISTDHYPYGLEAGESWGNDKDYLPELYGYEPSDIFKRDHSALIIWSGCLEEREEPIVVDTPVYSLDILPTLSNLFGVEFDSRLLVGRDVFSEASPLVLWTNYSWLTDKGTYDARTGKFTPKAGVTVDDDYVKRIKAIVGNKINFSKSAISLDYYDVLFGEK